jgi:hypothetical protein
LTRSRLVWLKFVVNRRMRLTTTKRRRSRTLRRGPPGIQKGGHR